MCLSTNRRFYSQIGKPFPSLHFDLTILQINFQRIDRKTLRVLRFTNDLFILYKKLDGESLGYIFYSEILFL
jgi:hypothetical protein